MALNRLVILTSAAALATAVACSSSTSPHVAPSGPITFTAGNDQTDTINTVLTQALVVRLNKSPAAGQVIQFESATDSTGFADAYVEPLNAPPNPQSFAAETTDVSGQASVSIVLGTRAGIGRIVVHVPQFGVVDTATFTVKPGHPAGLHVSPADTTLLAGSPLHLRVMAVDRGGDSLPVTATVTASQGTTVSANTVSATTPTRATIMTAANGITQQTFASFVPTGAFAGASGATITVMNFDGTHATHFTVPSSRAVGNMKFAPDGAHLVWDQSSSGCDALGSTIIVSDLSGNTQVVDQTGGADQYPSYSRDGTWIYFTKLAAATATWRVHPDGTGADSLTTLSPSADVWPSASPDGQHVAYIADDGSAPNLRVLTLSTGAVSTLPATGWSPQWSPNGNQIGYITGVTCEGTISTINADGTGNRALSGTMYFSNFDWSPDSKWLIAIDGTGYVDIINATSGQAIPLTYGTAFQFGSVSWKPQ